MMLTLAQAMQLKTAIFAILMGLLVIFLLLTACSDTTPVRYSDPAVNAANLERHCTDPVWKAENLGLWYSVCRKPMQWY